MLHSILGLRENVSCGNKKIIRYIKYIQSSLTDRYEVNEINLIFFDHTYKYTYNISYSMFGNIYQYMCYN